MNKKDDEYRGMGTDFEETGDSRGAVSRRRLKTFDSFRNPVFRLYYGTMAGHWASLNMQMVARSLLIYRITGSGAILGGMALANAIPMLLLSLVGGALADRLQKKHILFVGQLGSAVVSLGVALALTLGYLGPAHPGSWWILIVSAILQGTIMGLIMPSRQAIIPEIVSGEQVMNAVSLNNLGMNFFRPVSPALAGFFIDAFDFDVVYYIMTAMYLMATVCVVLMPRTRRAITTRGSSTLTDVSEGLRYIRGNKTILLILLFVFFATIFGMPFMHLLPMFTEDILKVSATEMGFLVSVSGFGAIIGSLVLASLPNRRRGVMLLLSCLILGLALVGFSFSHWWYPSLMIMVFVGLGQTGMMTLSNSLVQYYVDADYRGRVMSFLMMGFGFASFGTFFAGILAEATGVQWSIGGLAMILSLVSVMMFLLVPRLRRLD